MKKLLAGEATTKELDLMLEIADNMDGKTICVFSSAHSTLLMHFVPIVRSVRS